ncbi:MAG: gliding motility-associated C-terminal domain-containing protein, partial [Bacteroidetes bacterium]|nr:gliding motility-associated C-terminal domain-containing protein [Bacteroidota bacterium]
MANQKLLLWILWLGLIASSFHVNAQQNPVEICDNAVDDDGDGLIDLNDSDCKCQILEPVSLIPNPSFEDNNCCPSNRGQMNCANEWIQASEATTDYLNTCGWTGWEGLPVPLPIPDGNGCVGFRDGRFGNSNSEPGWKEYTGACLTHPLEEGISYKFRFHIGFTHPINSPPIQVTFFGSTDCDNLPFGLGDPGYGCPANGTGWRRLGAINVSGSNEWKMVEINITPTVDIYAIAIGPPCQNAFATTSLYYFFDNLILASEDLFDFEISLTGHPCDTDITMKIPDLDSTTYQWYKDGIALVGETGFVLSHIYGDGTYQVKVESPILGCRVTPSFKYEKPVEETFEMITICEDETYYFANNLISDAGVYIDSLKTWDGCDSISIVDLSIFYNTGDSVEAKIFPEEIYEIGQYRLHNPGEYTL